MNFELSEKRKILQTYLISAGSWWLENCYITNHLVLNLGRRTLLVRYY